MWLCTQAPEGDRVILEWGETEQQCFYDLREIISSELILALSDLEQKFVLTTDASDTGYGAMLEQESEESNIEESGTVHSKTSKTSFSPKIGAS